MPCKYKDEIKKFLDGKDTNLHEEFIVKHMEECEECNAMLNNNLEDDLKIPQQNYEDDEVLISKIKKRNKGIKRIIIFSIVGFLIGLLSNYYTRDNFIITKALMALPYKISELILMGIMPKGEIDIVMERVPIYTFYNYGYFPKFTLLTLIAERFTPALIGAGIYGSLGYLTGDRKIFTKRKYFKYAAIGIVILSIWLSTLFGIYQYSTYKIYSLTGINQIQIVHAYEDGVRDVFIKQEIEPEKYDQIIQGFGRKIYKGFKGKATYDNARINDFVIIDFGLGRRITAKVDINEKIIIVDNGDSYRLPDSFFKTFGEIVGRDIDED